jgi:rubrerythrin
MPAFQNPFAGNLPGRTLDDGEIARALRLDLANEEEATATYMAHANAMPEDGVIRKVLTSIANEERVHAGELQMLIDIVTNDEFKFLLDGMREVISTTGVGKLPGE